LVELVHCCLRASQLLPISLREAFRNRSSRQAASMLSQQALLDIGEEMDDDRDGGKVQLADALSTTKQKVQALIGLAEMPDHPEVVRMGVLLQGASKPWAAPSGLRKIAETSLLYLGQPRVLAIVCLRGKDAHAQSAAAQLLELSEIIARAAHTGATGGRVAAPLTWPLQDKTTVLQLGAKVLWAKDSRSCLATLSCPFSLRRCVGDIHPDARASEVIHITANHYGGSAAFPFAWTRHYARALWAFIAVLLPPACILGALLRGGMMTVELEESTVGSLEHVLWEIIKLASVVWMLLVAKYWQSPDLSGGMPVRDPRPVEGWSPRCGNTASAVLAALNAVVVVFVVLFIAQCLFVFVFWLEVYLAYEWGDCINLGCRDAETKWGFLGWLVSITPGILEAILFALYTEVSILVVDLLLWIRNYQFLEARMLFRFAALVTVEAIGKLGTFGILALVFVPEWDDESTLSGLPPNFSSMTSAEQRIARNDVDCSDLPDVAIFGRSSLLCLRRRLDSDYRRWLFQAAMKGPFVVAPFVAILIKVLLPIVLQKFQACFWGCERRQRTTGKKPCCSCPVTHFIIRAAGLIFAYDGGKVGCLRFLCYGNPFQPEDTKEAEDKVPDSHAQVIEPDTSSGMSDGSTHSELHDADTNADSTVKGDKLALKPRPKLIRRAQREVLEKVFNPENIVLDNLLSIQWVGFFAAVWPWGCIPTLAAWILQTRAAFALLLISKRRAFPEPPYALQRVAQVFILVMAHVAALWHVALSIVTYNSRLSTTPAGVIVGLLAGLWLAVVLLMWLAAWLVHLGVSRLARVQRPSCHVSV